MVGASIINLWTPPSLGHYLLSLFIYLTMFVHCSMIACDCELVLKDRHQANICAWGLASVVSRGLQGPPKTTHHNPLVQDGG